MERFADRPRFSLPSCTGRFVAIGALAFASAIGCGAGTRHQATVMQDAPAPATAALADAGKAPMPVSTDAGVAITTAPPPSNDDVDAGAPVPSHPPVKVAGRCVDMLLDAKVRGKLPKEADLFQEPTQVDLDGDGEKDFIYTVGATGRDYSGFVYITRGSCGIMVFPWVGSTPQTATTSTRGFTDLEISSTCEPTCCPKTSVTTWHWNGSTYAKGAMRVETHDCSHHGSP